MTVPSSCSPNGTSSPGSYRCCSSWCSTRLRGCTSCSARESVVNRVGAVEARTFARGQGATLPQAGPRVAPPTCRPCPGRDGNGRGRPGSSVQVVVLDDAGTQEPDVVTVLARKDVAGVHGELCGKRDASHLAVGRIPRPESVS